MWRVLLCIICVLSLGQAGGATEIDSTCRSFVIYESKKQCLLFTNMDEVIPDVLNNDLVTENNPTDIEMAEESILIEIIDEEVQLQIH
ncbi:MAG: hypothetical protein RLZZ230_805 [Candidatus Parcubacteria bacterium]|jgi:hypothetical protein